MDPVRYCTLCRAVYHSEFARCPNDGGMLVVADRDPLVGTTVAHYDVEAYIGGGAMGRVYRARHAHLHHKLFALKVLRGDLAATMSMRMRFTQEAEAASEIAHDNVVSVVDFGRTEHGLLYLAMDFVAGSNLRAVLAAGPLPAARVVGIARQLCRGLAHAHDHGLVHRDLKPDNILVVPQPDGELARIVDFGLAIHADPDAARLTTAGIAVGTPVYAAPEQIHDPDGIDHRADLFALGVTMFEMLAGTIPFDGTVLEILEANASGVRPPIAAPPRLERLVHRLMAPQRDDRPMSARAVLDELDAIERGDSDAVVEPVDPKATTALVSVVTHDRAAATSGVRTMHARALRGRVVAAAVVVAAAAGAAAFVVGGDTQAEAPVALAAMTTTAQPRDHRAPVVHAPVVAPHVTQRLAALPPPPPPIAPLPPRRVAKPIKPRAASTDGPMASVMVPDSALMASVAAPVIDDHVEPAAPPDITPIPAAAATRVPDVRPVHAPVVRRADVVTDVRLTVEALDVRGSLTAGQIKRALDRVVPALRACYLPAATHAGKSPTVIVRVRFEIDESQRARSIRASGGELPELGACASRALELVRTEAPPDVGTVDVGFGLAFVPVR